MNQRTIIDDNGGFMRDLKFLKSILWLHNETTLIRFSKLQWIILVAKWSDVLMDIARLLSWCGNGDLVYHWFNFWFGCTELAFLGCQRHMPNTWPETKLRPWPWSDSLMWSCYLEWAPMLCIHIYVLSTLMVVHSYCSTTEYSIICDSLLCRWSRFHPQN